jgi:hypothetical protein
MHAALARNSEFKRMTHGGRHLHNTLNTAFTRTNFTSGKPFMKRRRGIFKSMNQKTSCLIEADAIDMLTIPQNGTRSVADP